MTQPTAIDAVIGSSITTVQKTFAGAYNFSELPTDGRAPEAAVVEHKWSLFLELVRLAQGGSCRHDAILRYFGDEAETLDGCGRCDVCVSLDQDAQGDPEEVTVIVRKALSAVARLRGRFGLSAAAKLLRGADDPRLAATGLD